MDYKKYQHIEKIGTSEVDNILEGDVYLFYKIDGTNGCIYLHDDGSLGFGSRNRELSLDNDNGQFMKLMLDDEDSILKLKTYFTRHPNHIIYGEWLVPQSIRRYKADAWRKFYIFDVFDVDKLEYISYDIYSKELEELGLLYIPLLAKLSNPSEDDIKALLDKTGDFLIETGIGEGIVIKNYPYRNRYGRQTWAKLLTEDFLSKKRDRRENNTKEKEEFLIEHKIIEKYLTVEHIQKERNKLIEKYSVWSDKNTFELLNRVFDEFFKDNWEIILKTMHDPTINFKALRRLSNNKVKDVIGL